MGFLVAGLSIVGILAAVALRLFLGQALTGQATTLVAVLFLGGVQLISLGVIGEYLGRIYDEVKGRPLYIVDEAIGFDRHPGPNGRPHPQPSSRRYPDPQRDERPPSSVGADPAPDA